MQRELDSLKQQLSQAKSLEKTHDIEPPQIAPQTLSSGDSMAVHLGETQTLSDAPLGWPQGRRSSTMEDITTNTPSKKYFDTASRNLDGREFVPDSIDDCFAL
jgi:hypothetical protein